MQEKIVANSTASYCLQIEFKHCFRYFLENEMCFVYVFGVCVNFFRLRLFRQRVKISILCVASSKRTANSIYKFVRVQMNVRIKPKTQQNRKTTIDTRLISSMLFTNVILSL